MHPTPRLVATSLAILLLALPVASAGTQVGLGDLLAPSFGLADGLLDGIGAATPAPVAPLVLPLLESGRIALDLLRAAADATIVGATDGDAGSSFGPPDAVGVRSGERVLVDGVAVPGQDVVVPERTIVVATPEVDRTVRTPDVVIPARQVTVPSITLSIETPPVGLPPVAVDTPPVGVSSPEVSAPPVRVATPDVEVPERDVDLDASRADLVVQSLRGELYLGPAGSMPYATPELRVGQSTLPAAVPRQVGATVPGLHVDGIVLVDMPGRVLLPAQRVDVLPAQHVEVTDGVQVLPGTHVTDVTVPGQSVSLPGARVPGQEQRVHVPGMQVGQVTVPGQEAHTPPVEVTDERVALPAIDQVFPVQGPIDDLGYIGYGRDGDSSLYPFACGPLVGCRYGSSALRPYVEYADGWLDLLAGQVDRGLVVDLT